ncbi:calcium-binding protein, partial [Campylobacter ureolyticus]|nr:calcium-binding protein [Campylobacter ureolyticus]
DGILVIDKNGNGIIDNGNELFGNFTTKNNGDMANNGFEALKDYDTNGDLIIDYRDDKFSELRVWQDLNSDGISNKGELKTLNELGIKSLNLKYKD